MINQLNNPIFSRFWWQPLIEDATLPDSERPGTVEEVQEGLGAALSQAAVPREDKEWASGKKTEFVHKASFVVRKGAYTYDVHGGVS